MILVFNSITQLVIKGDTVIGHSTRNPEIQGSNPGAGNNTITHLAIKGDTVIGHSTRNPKIQGSNPAAGTNSITHLAIKGDTVVEHFTRIRVQILLLTPGERELLGTRRLYYKHVGKLQL